MKAQKAAALHEVRDILSSGDDESTAVVRSMLAALDAQLAAAELAAQKL